MQLADILPFRHIYKINIPYYIMRQPMGTGRSSLLGACELCSREAKHTCRFCHRRVCDLHYNSQREMCVICAGSGRAATPTGNNVKAAPKKPMQLIPGSICAVCSKEATHVCKNCGRSVCDDHFNKNENLCVICHIRNERERMRREAEAGSSDGG